MTDTSARWWVVIGGFLLLASSIGWATIEYWRHGTIHTASALFVVTVLLIGVGLFAGLERLTGVLKALTDAIREYRRPPSSRTREHDVPPDGGV